MAFKGKSIIELTDVNTGEVEVHEDENMVTNALATVFSELMCDIIYPLFSNSNLGIIESSNNNRLNNYSKFGLMPLYNYGIGGIFLFEAPQTEDVNNIYPKGTAVLTGYASNTVNGVQYDKKLGSMDIQNSGPIEGGYKFVWDFTTEQANGIISCLALTTAAAGRTGLGMYYLLGSDKTAISPAATENLSGTFIPVCSFDLVGSSVGNTPTSQYTSKTTDMIARLANIVKFDPSTRIAISCQRTAVDTVCVDKLKIPNNVLHPNFLNDAASFEILDSFEITFTESLSGFGSYQTSSSDSCCFCEDISDPNIIWFFNSARYASGNNLHTYLRWAKIDLANKSGTTGLLELPKYIDAPIGNTQFLFYDPTTHVGSYYSYNKGYTNGYYIVSYSNAIVWHNKLFWLYNVGNKSSVIIFSLPEFKYEATYTASWSNASVYKSASNYNNFVYIKSSDILYTNFGYFDSEENFHQTYPNAGNLNMEGDFNSLFAQGKLFEYNGIIYSFSYYYNSSISFKLKKFLYTPMLHTINNLSSAVQKTVAKTMKITYILTEVDE